MNEILDYLKKNKFEFDDSSIIKDDNGSITHIYTGKWDLYYCIISPHSGNYYNYILMVNHKRTMDRWAVCDFEREFKNHKDLIDYLDTNMIRIYQDILDIYVSYCMDNRDDDYE